MQRTILSLWTMALLCGAPGCDKGETKGQAAAAKTASAPSDTAVVNNDSAAGAEPAAGEPVRIAAAPEAIGDTPRTGAAPEAIGDTPRTGAAPEAIDDAPRTGAAPESIGDAPRTSAVGKVEPASKVKAATGTTADSKAAPPAEAEAPASGESLAQKQGWADYTKQLGVKIDAVNKACGTKLSASYDKSTYTDFDPLQDRTQSACQQAVTTLSAICANDAGKESVAKLGKVTCKFSTAGTGVALAGNGLVVKIDPVRSSITGKAAGSYSWASAIKEVL